MLLLRFDRAFGFVRAALLQAVEQLTAEADSGEVLRLSLMLLFQQFHKHPLLLPGSAGAGNACIAALSQVLSLVKDKLAARVFGVLEELWCALDSKDAEKAASLAVEVKAIGLEKDASKLE